MVDDAAEGGRALSVSGLINAKRAARCIHSLSVARAAAATHTPPRALSADEVRLVLFAHSAPLGHSAPLAPALHIDAPLVSRPRLLSR